MEWPSKNVPQGGIFNNAKVNYSPETREFVQTLMNESKMTMLQRNKINYSLRNGDPLPAISKSVPKSRRGQLFEVTIRPGSSKRRSLDTIRQSGAYERDNYKPMHPQVDREKAKDALIHKMAFGNETPNDKGKKAKPARNNKNGGQPPEINRYEELKQEIKEREDWLAEMVELGEGQKYRGLIRLQILERLNEIETLKVQE